MERIQRFIWEALIDELTLRSLSSYIDEAPTAEE